MRAKPKTTYVTACPATWDLIRAGYLSGLSAPTAAARFGVSVGALRKRAQREGWTKRAFVSGGGRFPPQSATPSAPAPHGPAQGQAPTAPTPDWDFNRHRLPPWLEELQRRTRPPDLHDPAAVTQLAMQQAVRCLAHGDAAAAARHARAAAQISGLINRYPNELRYKLQDDPANDEARQSALDEMVFQIGATLAERLLTGAPIPEPYLQRAARWRERYLDPADPAVPPSREDYPDEDPV